MEILAAHTGHWTGINEFRMMPDDPFVEAPATADVTIASAGNLASIGYTWSHRDDGPQDGLIVLGVDDGDRVIAFWGDSWHQQPAPKVLGGAADGPSWVVVGYEYGGGWEWRITVDASDPDSLALQMDNVIPANEATAQIASGPYVVMSARLARAGAG